MAAIWAPLLKLIAYADINQFIRWKRDRFSHCVLSLFCLSFCRGAILYVVSGLYLNGLFCGKHSFVSANLFWFIIEEMNFKRVQEMCYFILIAINTFKIKQMFEKVHVQWCWHLPQKDYLMNGHYRLAPITTNLQICILWLPLLFREKKKNLFFGMCL